MTSLLAILPLALALAAPPRAAAELADDAQVADAGAGPGQGGEAPRGVLLITIDALRADHVSGFGYDLETTPNLDRLARQGTRFTQCFASAPLPIPSHVALFTGCEPLLARRVLPGGEGTDEQRWSIPDELPRLAVEFLARGYATAAFVDDHAFSETFGFGAGFQHYWMSPKNARGSHLMVQEALQWILARGRDERWFAVLHLNDLERCWYVPDLAREDFFQPRAGLAFVPPVGATDDVFFAIPHDRWRGGARTLGQYIAIYDGHLRKVDEALGRMMESLKAARLLDRTVVSVVGNFGVQFGEAGLYLRSGRYSMADLHVPWIVRVPPQWPAEREPGGNGGQGVEALASLIDVAPTLLELAGVPPPSGMQGVSQARYVIEPGRGEPPAGTTRTTAFASCGLQEGVTVLAWPRHCLELLVPDRTQNAVMRRSWFGEDRLSEGSATVRFYDRLLDPHPPLESPVPDPPPPEFVTMRERASKWLENVTLARRVLQENLFVHERVDAEMVRRLREAGYLGNAVGER